MDPRAKVSLGIALQNAENSLHIAKSKVLGARSLREAVEAASSAGTAPYLRAVVKSLPAFRDLRFTTVRKLQELMDKQLKALEGQSLEKRKEELARLERMEWVHLRGDYVEVLSRAQRKGRELLR